MSNGLRRATGPTLAVLVAIMAGCGPDATSSAVDPLAIDLIPAGMTETVVIENVEYTYGCPDFPCPVTDLVKSHVEGGQWMWLARNASEQPTIYLYVLMVPVVLRVPEKGVDPPPPFLKLDPVLTGPEMMMGTHLQDGQLACLKVGLEIVSPDGRPWSFLTGERLLTFDDASTLRTGLFKPEWGYLDGHLYGIYPGPGRTGAYDVDFMVRLRGEDGELKVLEHAMRCEDPDPPPPVPLRPHLEGPDVVRGERVEGRVICRDVDLDLISPDGGPWDFVSGKSTLKYLRWDLERPWKEWAEADPERTVKPLSPDTWHQLLHGNYTTVPKQPWLTYAVGFGAMVERLVDEEVYDYGVDYWFLCVDPDIWDLMYRAPR